MEQMTMMRWECDMGHVMSHDELIGAGYPPGCPQCAAQYPGAGMFRMRPHQTTQEEVTHAGG